MRTSHKSAVAALGIAALLGLTACSADAEGDAESTVSPTTSATATEAPEPTEADIAAVDSIVWNEDEDGVPVLEFEDGLEVSTTVERVVSEGDGEVLEDGMYINLHFIGFDGADGAVAYDTYSSGGTQAYKLVDGAMAPALYDALIGKTVGSQLILAETYETTDAETGEAVQVSSFTAVTIDSINTVLDKAEGEAVDPVDGLPVVTLDDSGAPSVEIPDADAPTELVSQTLIEGEGDVVESDDYLVVNYSGWLWSDGTSFDSSWDRGTPAEFSLTSVIEGWTEGLAGHTVGSQVLLVIPPEMGYGDEDSASIPGGSTLVFVVDILGVL
ncbi:FKBP-type peptidyl-prolyl cis-trans isomerase [Demequina sp. B12]|uniref:FKBP-type peptidyl-prolyl cis-trans isomerase n=1 Tax=Demequina sp. B12 TaxID=2992757 RepID=UPI00237BE853|nr:FKBP-type peptidyl-prolyl cis-trans isomerase [Demequina sp. B12]MDE0573745.1 FKBP-type peptidyl-prolyl cis-trans isomerase [Demequina sp. B12]